MSNETPAAPVAATVAPVAAPAAPAAPAKPLTAIEIIEQDLISFGQQKLQAARQAEQAVANVHAIDGAIQATQHLLGKLKAEAAKALAFAEAEAKAAATFVESEAKKL